MAVLNPSKLESIDYGQQAWNGIFTADMQRLNDYLAKFEPLWNLAGNLGDGALLKYNGTTKKWETVTGYSGTVTVGAQTLTYQGGVLVSVA